MTKEEIRDRMFQLHTILDECEVILNGKESDFWRTLSRIYSSKKESYLQDSYQAAESEDKSIRNFLGRMEALDWAVNLVERDFTDQAKRAKDELLALQNQLKELDEIDKGVDSIIQDPMYREPGTL